MILLWGLSQDGPLSAVRDALQRRGAPVFFLDQRDVLNTELELLVDGDLRGTLRTRNRDCDLKPIAAVYVRCYDSHRLPDIEEAGEGSAAWCHAAHIDEILTSWLELTSALIVNRPSAMASNNSKPYQASLIRSYGFAIPDTLITTDPCAAQDFWERHGTVVYKSISAVRSIVSRLTPEHLSRLADIRWCPTQFQQYIPGHDCRVHVVGDAVFACEVISDADDYRYAGRQGAKVQIRSFDLPEEWAKRSLALAAAMKLIVAGIDLRRTPEGKWYCFEVNPSPGFTYYQAATHQPIDEAIAQLLVAGLGV